MTYELSIRYFWERRRPLLTALLIVAAACSDKSSGEAAPPPEYVPERAAVGTTPQPAGASRGGEAVLTPVTPGADASTTDPLAGQPEVPRQDLPPVEPAPRGAQPEPQPVPVQPAPVAAPEPVRSAPKDVVVAREEPPPPPVRERPAPVEPTRADVARALPAPKPVPPSKPLDPALRRTIVFQTKPPGAKVRLIGTGGRFVEAPSATPAVFVVPADVYAWEVEMGGYLPDRSDERTKIDVVGQLADTIVLTLTTAGDWRAKLANANEAFTAKRCAEAITLYGSLERPAQMSSELGQTWLESRTRLAQCMRDLRQYPQAVAVFKQVLEVEPRQWGARYEMANTLCLARDYRQAASVYSDVGEGPLLNRVSSDRREAVQALARYGRGLCKFREWNASPQPERHPEMREPALRLLQEFVGMADEALSRPMAGDVKLMLTRALADAKDKLQDMGTGKD